MDRIRQLTYPDGTTVSYEYNTRGLLETIPGVISQIDYKPSGQNALIALSNELITTYSYDYRLRLENLNTVRSKDGLELQNLNYNYDSISNITSITDNRSDSDLNKIGNEMGINSNEAKKFRTTQSFLYDSLYRLTQANSPSIYGTIHYRFDRIGNMVRKEAVLIDANPLMNLGEMNYGGNVGSWNRLSKGVSPGPHAITSTEKGSENGGLAYTYDNNGNITSENGMNLTWDHNNRLAALEKKTKTAYYSYDYIGTRKKRLISDSEHGSSENILYIDKFSEFRNDKLMKYVYEGDKRVARLDTVASSPSVFQPSYFYLHDHLGSTSITLNSQANVTEQLANYPYGHPRLEKHEASLPSATDYKFTGKERDVESGLHYFEARYLVGHIGRFASVDPLYAGLGGLDEEKFVKLLGNPQEWNVYGYVGNNPVNLIDPAGLWYFALIGAGFGGKKGLMISPDGLFLTGGVGFGLVRGLSLTFHPLGNPQKGKLEREQTLSGGNRVGINFSGKLDPFGQYTGFDIGIGAGIGAGFSDTLTFTRKRISFNKPSETKRVKPTPTPTSPTFALYQAQKFFKNQHLVLFQ